MTPAQPQKENAAQDLNSYAEIFNSIAPGDYYGDSIDVVNGGTAIRLKVAGKVIVAPLRDIFERLWSYDLAVQETRQQWQPIETAPKDTRVLVWAYFPGDWGYTENRYGVMRATFCNVVGEGWIWQPNEATGQYWKGFTPTLWAPIPPDPDKVAASLQAGVPQSKTEAK